MSKRVVIVDYQLSNLKSVEYACAKVGLHFTTSSDKAEISKADALILPGIGAFGDAMQNMKKLGVIPILKKKINSGTPFMGVCLGLQLLFTTSEEFGKHEGLDIISGEVKKFPAQNKKGEPLRVPQIAWNQLEKAKSDWKKSPFSHLKSGDFVYFVHSFYVVPKDKNIVLSTTNYSGFEYCSSILKDNVFAVQFHPEKSTQKGLDIYGNWGKQHQLI